MSSDGPGPSSFRERAPWLRLFAQRLRGGQDSLQHNGELFSVGELEGARTATGDQGRWPELFAPLVEAPAERPWVWCKAAASLDGRIATRTGEAQWVTGELARRRGRRIRGRVDGIMVGVGTILADDPLLTARSPSREPLRIVMDSRGRSPTAARLLGSEGGRVIFVVGRAAPSTWRAEVAARGAEVLEVSTDAEGRVALPAALRALRRRGVRRLLVEGGARLHGACFDQGLVDWVHWFIACRVIGGAGALSAVGGAGVTRLAEAASLSELRFERLGQDLFVSGRVSA